jgi:hypothetical protein
VAPSPDPEKNNIDEADRLTISLLPCPAVIYFSKMPE